MASGDYYKCDFCNKNTFYDAYLHYEDSGILVGVGDMKVLCTNCAQTYAVVIQPKIVPLSPIEDKVISLDH